MTTPATTAAPRQFPCKNCGADLVFDPGTTSLKCPYCGAENEIAPAGEVVESDYQAAVASLASAAPMVERLTVHCNACGAETDMSHDVAADKCPFCGAAIVATASSKKLIKPGALLPFKIKREEAAAVFKQWVAGRWFAPSDLLKLAQGSRIDGVYVPAWTYDSQADTAYRGERGDDYWVSESYTTTENGQTVTRTRQVRKTRWSFASGRVHDRFDDVMVLATRSLPPKQAGALEPWDLKSLVAYTDEYLSGFAAESYRVGLDEGFAEARQIMDNVIRQTINRDIGGDHQRIQSVQSRFYDITFKHILLPMWISAYRYRDRVFRFLVNARTGEVQGERPYSAVKITLTIIGIVLAILIVWLLFALRGH